MGSLATTGAEREEPSVLERERELRRIGVALDDAVAGAGGVLLVEGPAGIGKTTLAVAARDRARKSGMRVLRAVGSQLERDIAYSVARQLFVPALRGAGPADRARLLDGADAAEAALHAGTSPEVGGVGSEYATLHALYWLLANISDEQPLLLIVDDAHWADRASARYLAFLAPRLPELPVLLLICARPDEWSPEALFDATTSDVAARPLVPAPLSPAACAQLTKARFDEPVEGEFAAACHQTTGGNPFLLRALLDELVGDHVPPRAASREVVLAMGPRVVTRAIVARLGRLPASARSLVAALVVLGDDAPAQQLAELAGLSLDELWISATELARVAVAVHGADLRFAHPVIRNAVAADIDPRELDRLHRTAAALLERAGAEPEQVAAHLLAVEPGGYGGASQTLRRAAREAIRSGAAHSAAAYLRRALAEPCPDRERLELLIELGQVERMIDGPAAIAHLREALSLTSDHREHAEVASLLARVLNYAARTEEAMATAVQALNQLPAGERAVRRLLQSAILHAGEHDLAFAAAQRELEAGLGEVQDEAGLGARRIQTVLAFHEMDSLARPAAACAARAQELLADELPLREDNGGSAFIGPIQMLMAAESELALTWLDRGLERARRDGDGFAVAAGLFARCWAHLRFGKLTDAVLDGRDGVQAMEQWGNEVGRVWCSGVLAEAQIEAGALEDAQRTLARLAPTGGGELPETGGWDVYRWSLGRLRLAHGDPRGCLDLTLEAAELDGNPRNPAMMPWRSRAAICLALLGEEPDRARKLVEEEVELAREWGAPGTLGAALLARGIVQGTQGGENSLRGAVAVLDGSACTLQHAQALVELGALLRRAGRRGDARDPLRAGLKLARLSGATPLAERADEELRASGTSSRNVLRTGIEELTSSEHRVVKMAASGKTNKEIAQSLFVTVKTVETHLHRSYQKLDVKSRSALAGALEAAV